MFKRIFLLVCCLLSFVSIVFAEVPNKPYDNIYVVDNAKMFDTTTTNKMLELGENLDKKHKAQIVAVTVNSLEGEDIEEFANKLFRDWGIGDKEINNGILILISKEDHKVRIEVGYGLEEVITDIYCRNQIKKLASNFKKEQYNEGILEIYTNITKDVEQFYDNGEKPSQMNYATMLIIVIIVVIILALFSSGSGGSSRYGGGFYSSSSSSGSSFGGGSSGGGGASGGW